MTFDIIDEIKEINTIAKGSGIRELTRLKKYYGPGNWKKMKGIAHIRLSSGKVKLAELHWYESIGMSLMVLVKRKLNVKGIWSKKCRNQNKICLSL